MIYQNFKLIIKYCNVKRQGFDFNAHCLNVTSAGITFYFLLSGALLCLSYGTAWSIFKLSLTPIGSRYSRKN